MKKRYIFLLVSFLLIVSVTYFLNNNQQNKFIEETKEEIVVMHNERDSVFNFADKVLINVMEQKKEDSIKMSDLDEMVKRKEIKIEDQVAQLKKLVNESNKMKKIAEEEKNKAIEMEEMAKLQKIESEKIKEKLIVDLENLEKENGSLKKKELGYINDIKELEEKVYFLRGKIDSLTLQIGLNTKNRKRGN